MQAVASPSITDFLLQHGAATGVVDAKGRTAAYCAVDQENGYETVHVNIEIAIVRLRSVKE